MLFRSDLSQHLADFAFPSHALIVRSESGSKPLIFKGIQAQPQLDEAVEQCWQESDQIVIENDLRAHLNPTRQQAIMTLAEKLVDRLSQLCHRCGLPGWGAVGVLRGATCEECGTFNENYPVGEIRGCAKCGSSEERDLEKKTVKQEESVLKKKYESLLDEYENLKKVSGITKHIFKPLQDWKIPVKGNQRDKSIAVVLASDWHYEEEVRPETVNHLNSFDLKIADNRISNFFNNIVKLIKIGRAHV